jgi:hypothetical protein
VRTARPDTDLEEVEDRHGHDGDIIDGETDCRLILCDIENHACVAEMPPSLTAAHPADGHKRVSVANRLLASCQRLDPTARHDARALLQSVP